MGKFAKSVRVVSAIQVNGHIYPSAEKAAEAIFNKMVARQNRRQEKKVGDIWADMPWRQRLQGMRGRCYNRVLTIVQRYY